MLWVVQHKWPSGVRFEFNCYHHWATLVIRECNGTGHFLHIKDRVTQGDTLAMITYVLGILPVIRDLRMSQPGVSQKWFADESGAGGTFYGI